MFFFFFRIWKCEASGNWLLAALTPIRATNVILCLSYWGCDWSMQQHHLPAQPANHDQNLWILWFFRQLYVVHFHQRIRICNCFLHMCPVILVSFVPSRCGVYVCAIVVQVARSCESITNSPSYLFTCAASYEWSHLQKLQHSHHTEKTIRPSDCQFDVHASQYNTTPTTARRHQTDSRAYRLAPVCPAFRSAQSWIQASVVVGVSW